MTELKFENMAQRIREARKEAGLSPAQLASAMGVSERMISHYEAGTKGPRASKIPYLAAATGKPIDYFFTGEYELVGPLLDPPILDPRLLDAIKELALLSPEEQLLIAPMVQAYVGSLKQDYDEDTSPPPNPLRKTLTTEDLVTNIGTLIEDHAKERATLLRQLDSAAEERKALREQQDRLLTLLERGQAEREQWQTLLERYAPPDLRSAWQNSEPGQAPTRPPRPAPEGDIPIEHLPPEQSRTKAAMHTAKPQRAKKK